MFCPRLSQPRENGRARSFALINFAACAKAAALLAEPPNSSFLYQNVVFQRPVAWCAYERHPFIAANFFVPRRLNSTHASDSRTKPPERNT